MNEAVLLVKGFTLVFLKEDGVRTGLSVPADLCHPGHVVAIAASSRNVARARARGPRRGRLPLKAGDCRRRHHHRQQQFPEDP